MSLLENIMYMVIDKISKGGPLGVIEMVMSTRENTRNMFDAGDLVIWRAQNGNEKIPVPAVVLHQEADTVTIKARFQDKLQQLAINARQLTSR